MEITNKRLTVDRVGSTPITSQAPVKPRRGSDRDPPRPSSTLGLLRTVNGTSGPSAPSPVSRTPSSRPFDAFAQLQKSAPSVVKTRQGSVLSRGFVLKTDYYATDRALQLDITLQGAPNLRQNRASMNVFGVAQPRIAGLKAILSVLQCRPNSPVKSTCHWFSTREEPIVYISGRPFVLRDSVAPRDSLMLSDRAENLEAIEKRLKTDILVEGMKFGGVILTHHEIDDDIIPVWTAVDASIVRTPREVMEELTEQGWSVQYYRIPITQDRLIEDNYLDAYFDVISKTDPLTTPLVFSCGMGAVRTTFAMTAACIIRRRQLIENGEPDPYAAPAVGLMSAPTPAATAALVQASQQQESNKSLLRLAYLLQQGLHDSQSAVELLLSQPVLTDNLRKALMGTYSLILSLLGCLDHGPAVKKLVDAVIDDCDHVVNLREQILVHRTKYSLTSMDDKSRNEHLQSAIKAMEKYFFLIAFASFVEDHPIHKVTFASWLKTRSELWNQVKYMRKSGGLKQFAPVADLSAISKFEASKNYDVSGGQVLGDEWSEYVIRNRSGIILREGTLLKSDQWKSESVTASDIRGAINFRNISGTNVYCLGQPTSAGVSQVLERVVHDWPTAQKILWITLREEPLVYINGEPYCLRLESYSLRNMKDYGGISGSRLETLEERLKGDVIAEAHSLEGKVLLHSETAERSVVPIWEDVSQDEVEVLKEVMTSQRPPKEIPLRYYRIPITAEGPPDFGDISDLMHVVLRANSDQGAIVINCQLGRGRSTLASIFIFLIQQWLHSSVSHSPVTPRRQMSRFSALSDDRDPSSSRVPKYHSYQVINNVLRVVRNGLKVKEAVDEAIDRCGQVLNIREAIEENRISAEQATDEKSKKLSVQRGIESLRRYFELMLFQAYLQTTPPDTIRTTESFESYVKSRPVFRTFENEMRAGGLNSLKPLERAEVADGLALPDEITQTVTNRSGSVLSASTILKSDFFSNLQKMSLPERIEGAANFREVPLLLDLGESNWDPVDKAHSLKGKSVVGTGMPQTDGARRVLERLDAAPDGKKKVYWTSLREEPVIYVAGRPHVLRLVDRPLQNVEATGITTDVVESMEKSLRRDVQREIVAHSGRILLHDEVEEAPGRFTITAQWESVQVEDVMTPRELFNMLTKEGYHVDYTRIAITDEQAPLPAALNQLVHRVEKALTDGDVIIQNCQMGRGRTTTGMVACSLIATIYSYDVSEGLDGSDDSAPSTPGGPHGFVIREDGSEEEAYLQGEYKTILQLVGILSHGKVAKRLTDLAIDQMEGVQNLRRAIFDYKIKIDACEPGSTKQKKLLDLGINYLFRYGALIVLSNYLIERRNKETTENDFAKWLHGHREIDLLLRRRTLD